MSHFVGGVKLPPVSKEFIDQMDQAFPLPDIQAHTSVEAIKWAAAQRAVVDWVKTHAAVKDSAADPVARQQAMVRYGA